MSVKFYYTYILYSTKDKKFYTGWTIDLRKRVNKHLSGRVRATKHRLPLELYYYEACRSRQDAMAREKFLKTGMGKRFLKNRMKDFLSTSL